MRSFVWQCSPCVYLCCSLCFVPVLFLSCSCPVPVLFLSCSCPVPVMFLSCSCPCLGRCQFPVHVPVPVQVSVHVPVLVPVRDPCMCPCICPCPCPCPCARSCPYLRPLSLSITLSLSTPSVPVHIPDPVHVPICVSVSVLICIPVRVPVLVHVHADFHGSIQIRKWYDQISWNSIPLKITKWQNLQIRKIGCKVFFGNYLIKNDSLCPSTQLQQFFFYYKYVTCLCSMDFDINSFRLVLFLTRLRFRWTVPFSHHLKLYSPSRCKLFVL